MQASNIPNYILRVLPLLSTPPHKALCLCSTQPCVYMQWELLCRYLSVKKMQGLPSTGLDMPLRIRHVICSWTPPPSSGTRGCAAGGCNASGEKEELFSTSPHTHTTHQTFQPLLSKVLGSGAWKFGSTFLRSAKPQMCCQMSQDL